MKTCKINKHTWILKLNSISGKKVLITAVYRGENGDMVWIPNILVEEQQWYYLTHSWGEG